MKRLFWLGVGVAVGVVVVRAVSKRAQAYSPRGIASSVQRSSGGLVGSVRSFVEDVRLGMAEREQQIHEAFSEGIALDADHLDDLDNLYPEHDYPEHDFDPEHGKEGTR